MDNRIKSKFKLTASMVVFGTIGIFRRYIPMDSAALAICRGVIGACAIFTIMLLTKRKVSMQSIKNNLLTLIISGAAIGFNWILLFEAYRFTTVAVATLCYYMAPVFVILLSPYFLKEKQGAKKLLCVAVSLIGMVMISGVLSAGGAQKSFKGILLGLGAASFYAGVIILNKKLKDISAYDKTLVQLGTASVVLLPYVALNGGIDFNSLSPVTILLVCFVGILHTGIAYAVYFSSMENLHAQTVALFSYIDPIVAVFLSALFLKEPMGIWEISGTILILSAAVISERE